MINRNQILEKNAKEQLKQLFYSITNVEIAYIDKLVDLFHLLEHFSKNSIVIDEGEIASNLFHL